MQKKKKEEDLCSVQRSTVTDQMCQQRFAKFYAGDFLLDIALWSDKPDEVNSNQIETLIKNNRHYTMQETADIFKISILLSHFSCVRLCVTP